MKWGVAKFAWKHNVYILTWKKVRLGMKEQKAGTYS